MFAFMFNYQVFYVLLHHNSTLCPYFSVHLQRLSWLKQNVMKDWQTTPQLLESEV